MPSLQPIQIMLFSKRLLWHPRDGGGVGGGGGGGVRVDEGKL